jgi:ferrous iron transport protein A
MPPFQGPPAPNIDMSPSVVTLVDLPTLAVARVLDVGAHPDDAARLKAMGICLGRRIQLIQAGDPLIVRVLGTRVGLSARLAGGVLVEPVNLTVPLAEGGSAP